jgi:hypothetical protein
MRKNRSMRLARRVPSITALQAALKTLREELKKAQGRDILPARRKIETHEAAIQILRSAKATKATKAASPAPAGKTADEMATELL